MEPKFQTSFIPKTPIAQVQTPQFAVVRTKSFLSFFAMLLFIVTLIACVSLFVYKNVLTQQLADADTTLVTARSDFEPEKIQELLDANTRIGSVTGLLNKHVVLSPLLALLQTETVRKNRLTSLMYANKLGKASVTLAMEAQGYSTMTEQEKDFSSSDFLKNQSFSDFALAENGAVKVNFYAELVPELISYRKQVENAKPAPVQTLGPIINTN